jgi:hypothetical protein
MFFCTECLVILALQPGQVSTSAATTMPQPTPIEPPTNQLNIASTQPSLPTMTQHAQPSISSGTPSLFHSQCDFLAYLKEHPKCKEYVDQLASGFYSIQGRRAVTQVAVSKLIDVYGHYVDSKLKEKVAGWLADLTKMKSADYFDPQTHKGFLSKDLENRRRHLPPSEKRWVWTKKSKFDVNDLSSTPTPLLASSTSECDLDGCPRCVTECVYCLGG